MYYVIQLSVLVANSLRRSRKARRANKISLGNYDENLPQQTTFSLIAFPLQSWYVERRIGARHMSVCGRFQAFASVKLRREALEDGERSRRDPLLPPYMPFAIPRVILVIRFSHAILCHEILRNFASYDENWRWVAYISYLDCNNYLILASQENDGVSLSLKIFFSLTFAYSSRKILKTKFSYARKNYIPIFFYQ